MLLDCNGSFPEDGLVPLEIGADRHVPDRLEVRAAHWAPLLDHSTILPLGERNAPGIGTSERSSLIKVWERNDHFSVVSVPDLVRRWPRRPVR